MAPNLNFLILKYRVLSQMFKLIIGSDTRSIFCTNRSSLSHMTSIQLKVDRFQLKSNMVQPHIVIQCLDDVEAATLEAEIVNDPYKLQSNGSDFTRLVVWNVIGHYKFLVILLFY